MSGQNQIIKLIHNPDYSIICGDFNNTLDPQTRFVQYSYFLVLIFLMLRVLQLIDIKTLISTT